MWATKVQSWILRIFWIFLHIILMSSAKTISRILLLLSIIALPCCIGSTSYPHINHYLEIIGKQTRWNLCWTVRCFGRRWIFQSAMNCVCGSLRSLFQIVNKQFTRVFTIPTNFLVSWYFSFYAFLMVFKSFAKRCAN